MNSHAATAVMSRLISYWMPVPYRNWRSIAMLGTRFARDTGELS